MASQNGINCTVVELKQNIIFYDVFLFVSINCTVVELKRHSCTSLCASSAY